MERIDHVTPQGRDEIDHPPAQGMAPSPSCPDLRTLKLVVEYEGTRYAGWQRQKRSGTVQQVIEEALSRHLGERITVVGAGRTDAGVHAAGQVASFRTSSSMALRGVLYGTNALLPEDVTLLDMEERSPGFHARRDARGKHYRYRILNRSIPSPLSRRMALWVSVPLDEGLMALAAAHLTGRHDFSSFRNSGSFTGDPVRRLHRLDIERDGEYLTIHAEGDGFLYKMVRNLAGTLVRVGHGKLDPDEMVRILASRDRGEAGPAAPAHGLCLEEVYY